MYADQTGLSLCKTCPARFYCETGTVIPSPCAPGFYCSANTTFSTLMPCPVGTFSNITGLGDASECTACTPGQFCAATPSNSTNGVTRTGGLTAPSGFIDPGFYSGAAGGAVDSLGRLSLTGNPQPCTLGHYCPRGSITPVSCAAGSYSNATGLALCISCDEGSYCGGVGLTKPTGLCDPGSWCARGNSVPAPVGGVVNVSIAVGDGDCDATNNLNYPSGGSNSPLELDGAVWMLVGGDVCPAGYRCPAGSTEPTACTPGFYQNITGQATCLTCPSGSYCPVFSMVTPIACPQGSDCAAGATAPSPCPVGKFAPQTGMSSCIPCTSGSYCATTGLSQPTGTCDPRYYCPSGSQLPNQVICPAGYFCPNGTAVPFPCPLGTFSNITGLFSTLQCSSCTAGWYCNSTALLKPTAQCLPGYTCPGGMVTGQENPTPPGYFSLTGAVNATACSPGSYQPLIAQSTCLSCDPGSYCGTWAMSAPVFCPAGSFCAGGTVTPQPCAAGTFTAATGAAICQTCPARSWCGANTVTPTPCPQGFWCAAGTSAAYQNPCLAGYFGNSTMLASSAECNRCTPGNFCSTNGLSSPTGPCSAGYLCFNTSTTPTPTNGVQGSICPAGGYCPQGSSAYISCLPGTYSSKQGNTNVNECLPCPAGLQCPTSGIVTPTLPCTQGYVCPNGTALPSIFCPPGSFCVTGTGSAALPPQPCAAGTFSGSSGAFVCQTCPARSWCGVGTITPVDCPRGYWCASGTAAAFQTPCSPGFFGNRTSLASAAECTRCTSGSYCATSGLSQPTALCSAGYVCYAGSTTPTPTDGVQGVKCPAGGYCPQGSSAYIPCSPGTYSSVQGNSQPSDCIPSPAGMVTPNSGTTSPIQQCPAGYTCPAGTSVGTSIPCPLGLYCPAGTGASPPPCPVGTYSNVTGSSSCRPCPARFFCSGQTITPALCPAGSYCPAGTRYATEFMCPPGTLSLTTSTGLASAAECLGCPAGVYCALPGMVNNPSGYCGPRFYCSGNASAPQPNDNGLTGGQCSPGYLCFYGARSRLPDITGGGPGGNATAAPCRPGTFCVQGAAVEAPCPVGTFNPDYAQGSCQICPAGASCNEGSITPGPCPPHKYCPQGVGDTTAPNCPDGLYSPAHSNYSNPAACLVCPAGKYCRNGDIAGDCSAGYWCRAGASRPDPSLQNGYGGDYGSPPSLDYNVTSGLCPIGYICGPGTVLLQSCVGGFRATPGGASQADCSTCPRGYTCVPGLAIPCPKGHYCPDGDAANITACWPGTMNLLPAQWQRASCIGCPAGYECREGAIGDLSSFVCPLGKYCEAGTINATVCPAGTFRSTGGARNSGECTLCTGGYFCPSLGMSNALPCPPGTYCPPGSVNITASDGGYYAPAVSPAQIVCPKCYYCPPSSAAPILCPPLRYCPLGSVFPYACPTGMRAVTDVNNNTRGDFADACVYCAAGTYQDEEGKPSCKPCTAGHICLGGTKVSRPFDVVADRGYESPAGYYAPAGSSAPTPCPPGTYNALTGRTNSSDCLPCEANSFNNQAGQSSCRLCATSAYSSPGSVTCTCKGRNREYQPSDGYCICRSGYEYFDESFNRLSEYDGDIDCQPIVYDVCKTGTARNTDGECEPLTASQQSSICFKQCPSGTGVYNPRIGVCECDGLTPVSLVCDTNCQATQPTVSLDPATNWFRVDVPVASSSSSSSSSSQSSASTSTIVTKTSRVLLVRPQDIPSLAGNAVCIPGLRRGLSVQAATAEAKGLALSGSSSSSSSLTVDGTRVATDGTVVEPCSLVSVSATKGRGFKGQFGLPKDIVQAVLTFVAAGGNFTEVSGEVSTTTTAGASRRLAGDISISSRSSANEQAAESLFPKLRPITVVDGVILPSHLKDATLLVPPSSRLASAAPPSSFVPARLLQTGGGSSSSNGNANATNAVSSDAPYIEQPVVCISMGDGVVFDITRDSSQAAAIYPVYLKDSLLNTNAKFDYGLFRQLQEKAVSQANVTSFIFTFTEAGLYDFASSANRQQRIVIAVMAPGSSCPTEAAIVPMTTAALIRLGARRSDDLLVAINWVVVGSMMATLVLIFIATLVGAVYFQKREWIGGPVSTRPKYKSDASDIPLLTMHNKGSIVKTEIIDDGASSGAGAGASAAVGADKDASSSLAIVPASKAGGEQKNVAFDSLAATVAAGAGGAGDGSTAIVSASTSAALVGGDALVEGSLASSLGGAPQAILRSMLSAAGLEAGIDGALSRVRSIDLDRWDDDDLDLREIIERLEAHASSFKAGFALQAAETRALVEAVHQEADAIKRLLAAAKFEQEVLASAQEDDVERKRTVASSVTQELNMRTLYDRRLTALENELMTSLVALFNVLGPGADDLAGVIVEQLKKPSSGSSSGDDNNGSKDDEEHNAGSAAKAMEKDEEQQRRRRRTTSSSSFLPAQKDAAALHHHRRLTVMEDVTGLNEDNDNDDDDDDDDDDQDGGVGASVLSPLDGGGSRGRPVYDQLQERMLDIQGCLSRLAGAVSEEKARRATSIPLWKALGELGAFSSSSSGGDDLTSALSIPGGAGIGAGAGGSEANLLVLLEKLQGEEASVDAQVQRLLETLDPFHLKAPELQQSLSASVLAFGNRLSMLQDMLSAAHTANADGAEEEQLDESTAVDITGSSSSSSAPAASSSSKKAAAAARSRRGSKHDDADNTPLLDLHRNGNHGDNDDDAHDEALGESEDSARAEQQRSAAASAEMAKLSKVAHVRFRGIIRDLIRLLASMQAYLPRVKQGTDASRQAADAQRGALTARVKATVDASVAAKAKSEAADSGGKKKRGALVTTFPELKLQELLTELNRALDSPGSGSSGSGGAGGGKGDSKKAGSADDDRKKKEEEEAKRKADAAAAILGEAGVIAETSSADSSSKPAVAAPASVAASAGPAAALIKTNQAMQKKAEEDARAAESQLRKAMEAAASSSASKVGVKTAEEKKKEALAVAVAAASSSAAASSTAVDAEDAAKAKARVLSAIVKDVDAEQKALEEALRAERLRQEEEIRKRTEAATEEGLQRQLRQAQLQANAEAEARIAKEKALLAAQHEKAKKELEEQLAKEEAASKAALATGTEDDVSSPSDPDLAYDRNAVEAALLSARKALEDAVAGLRAEHERKLQALERQFQDEREKALADLEKQQLARRKHEFESLRAKHLQDLEQQAKSGDLSPDAIRQLVESQEAEVAALGERLASLDSQELSALEKRLASTLSPDELERRKARLVNEFNQEAAALAQKVGTEQRRQQESLRRRLEERRLKREREAAKAAAEGRPVPTESQESSSLPSESGLEQMQSSLLAKLLDADAVAARIKQEHQQEAFALAQATQAERRRQEAELQKKLLERKTRRERLLRKKEYEGALLAAASASAAAGNAPAARSAAAAAALQSALAAARIAQGDEGEAANDREEEKVGRAVIEQKHKQAEDAVQSRLRIAEVNAEERIAALRSQFEGESLSLLSAVQSEKRRQQASTEARLAERKDKRRRELLKKQEEEMLSLTSRVAAEVASVADNASASASPSSGATKSSIDAALAKLSAEQARELALKEEEAKIKARALEAESEKRKRELQEKQERERKHAEAEAAAELQKRIQQEEESRKAALDAKRKEMETRLAAAAAAGASGGAAEVERLRKEHEKELASYEASMEEERRRQKEKLDKQLEARRAKKERELKRKQDQEMADEMARQEDAKRQLEASVAAEKEKAALAVLLAEQQQKEQAQRATADDEIDKQSGHPSSGGNANANANANAASTSAVIEEVLRARHSKETSDLVARQYGERNATLRRVLEESFEQQREAKAALIASLHDGGNSPEDDEVESAVAQLEQQFETTRVASQKLALEELELRHANEQVALRSRQLAEVVDAFKQLAPEQVLLRADAAEAAKQAADLAAFQSDLERKRNERLAQVKAEKERFEAELRLANDEELARVEAEHSALLEAEKKRAEDQLRARKERLAREQDELRKKKLEETSTLDMETRDKVMREFEEERAKVEEKLEVVRTQQQAKLEAQLQAKKAKKLARLAKQQEEARVAAEAAAAAKAAEEAEANKRAVEEAKRQAERSRQQAAQEQRDSAVKVATMVTDLVRDSESKAKEAEAKAMADASSSSTVKKEPATTATTTSNSNSASSSSSSSKRVLGERILQLEKVMSELLTLSLNNSTGAAASSSSSSSSNAQAASTAQAQAQTQTQSPVQPSLPVDSGSASPPPPHPDDITGRLVLIEESNLHPRQQLRLAYARRMVAAMCSTGADTAAGATTATAAVPCPPILLLPAAALPSPFNPTTMVVSGSGATNSASSAYFWDHKTRRLCIRASELFDRAGEGLLALAYVLARVAVTPNDLSAATASPASLAAFQTRAQANVVTVMTLSFQNGIATAMGPALPLPLPHQQQHQQQQVPNGSSSARGTGTGGASATITTNVLTSPHPQPHAQPQARGLQHFFSTLAAVGDEAGSASNTSSNAGSAVFTPSTSASGAGGATGIPPTPTATSSLSSTSTYFAPSGIEARLRRYASAAARGGASTAAVTAVMTSTAGGPGGSGDAAVAAGSSSSAASSGVPPTPTAGAGGGGGLRLASISRLARQ